MQSFPSDDNRPSPAPCRGARNLLAGVIGACLVILLGVGADMLLRAPDQAADSGIWVHIFSFSSPALHSPGTPGRHPETIHPAVDLRFAAGLETAP